MSEPTCAELLAGEVLKLRRELAQKDATIAGLREALAWALAFVPTRTKRNNAHFQEKLNSARALLAPAPPREVGT